MPPLTLEGDTLGQKHQHFNKLVDDAVRNKQTTLANINGDDDDIENLIKISIAARNKNVDYILEVLKSEDLLYVSRALKRCAWLVTEPQYAHIVNPQHLHHHLFPHMTTKAINKLILHIKLNLKEEKRVEEFYEYIKDHKSDEALRWLQHCSLSFVENVLKNGQRIPLHLFKRLCRRSFQFIKYYTNVDGSKSRVLKANSFLFYNHTEEFLDFLDKLERYIIPALDAKHTEIIMKKCADRILNNFEKYATYLNLAIVVKFIKKDEIKDFVFKQIRTNDLNYYLTNYDNLKHFVKCLPREDRLEFIIKVFDEKAQSPHATFFDSEPVMLRSIDTNFVSRPTYSYRWYRYAPFNVAFHDLVKLIRAESAPAERCDMLGVLVTAARRDPQHLHTVLKYYQDKHGNEPVKFKLQFINKVVTQIAVYKLNEKTWNILDRLFHSVEVYAESDKNVQACVKSIILYNVINGHELPTITEKKFTFDTFQHIQSRLDQEQKDKLYTYLFNYVSTKLHDEKIHDEAQFKTYMDSLKKALNLLNDWKKDFIDHPLILEKIQLLISIKQENSWNVKLSEFYNINKTWRQQLFSVSLSLSANEETCLNALKHDPTLLARHSAELHAVRAAEAAVPRRLLAKLRIYWPHTIAKEWTNDYFKLLNNTTGHKAVIQGLFIILPQKQSVDIAEKYVPEEMKIDWELIDLRELGIRKNIANYLHVTRPQPPLDVVLSYAKGDYLQYAVPSLSAILYNLSKTHAPEHILKFLGAPVSLKKIGITFAFNKLESDKLRPLFLNIWKSTNNPTIRAIIFVCTHKMLCKVENSADAKDIWLLLSSFIDNLSNEESKQIYNKLGQVKDIHISVRAEYFTKSYKLLQLLPAKNNCESVVNNLINYAPIIMNLLDPDFVAAYLLVSIDEKFCTKRNINTAIISSFLLYGHSVDEQLMRFDKVLLPIMECAILSWDAVIDGEYLVKNNFNDFSYTMAWQFKELVTRKQINAPVKLFAAIKNLFEEKMATQEKYLISTYWKLAETYAKLVDEHKWMLDNKDENMSAFDYQNYFMSGKIEKMWEKMYLKILPIFGSKCLQYLKEDVRKFFPSIYTLFAVALDAVFHRMLSQKTFPMMVTLKHMLGSEDCIASYILVCEKTPTYVDDQEQAALRGEIRQILSLHPSEEVQMHFHKAFRDVPNIKQNQDSREEHNTEVQDKKEK